MSSALDPFSPWAFRGGHWERVLANPQAPGPLGPADAREPAGPGAPPTASSPPADVTLLTWNTWFGRLRFRERSAALLDELSWRAPDVVAFQEVTEPLMEMIAAHPYVRAHYQLTDLDGVTFDPRSSYGVLMLSRLPIARAGLLELPSNMGRRLLVVQLQSGLCVATVHLESTRECAAERAEQLRIILPELAALSPDVVLMGDMNFAPDASLETSAVEPSFVDVWAQKRPNEPGYSVDSLRNELRRRSDGGHTQKRIDRVFLRSARWRAQDITLTGTTPIDKSGTFTSDHFGLEAVLTASQPS